MCNYSYNRLHSQWTKKAHLTVCVCVFVCVCVYVCMYVCMYVCIVAPGESSIVRRVICPKRIGIGLRLELGLAPNFGISTTSFRTNHK